MITLLLCSCVNNHKSLETHKQTSRVNQDTVAKYTPPESHTEEYINRICKRVTLVSNIPATNYNFRVIKTEELSLEIDKQTSTVKISQGILEQLKDEAELAAVLLLSTLRIENLDNVDREAATLLSRAGYDPQAMLDLQEQYFYTANSNKTVSHWMRVIYPTVPSAGMITSNKIMLQNMPKGLTRDEDDYKKQIHE